MKNHFINICRAYTQDRLSCRSIARKFNISETQVYNILKQNKVQLRTKSEANKIFDDNIIINLYNIGLSIKQISEILGLHPTTITKRFKKINFPTRNKDISFRIRYTDAEFKKYFMNPCFINEIIEG